MHYRHTFYDHNHIERKLRLMCMCTRVFDIWLYDAMRASSTLRPRNPKLFWGLFHHLTNSHLPNSQLLFKISTTNIYPKHFNFSQFIYFDIYACKQLLNDVCNQHVLHVSIPLRILNHIQSTYLTNTLYLLGGRYLWLCVLSKLQFKNKNAHTKL